MPKSNDFNLKTFKTICMKNIYLPLVCIIVFLSSCSSAYKTAQTPDDVYYSPGSQKQVAASGSNEYYNANADDQYLMMKSQDPNRWSYFDDYSYDNFYSPYYSPYGMYSPYSFGYSPFGFYSGFGFSPFMSFGFGGGYLSNYYLWNGMYNPYYGGVIVVTKYPTYNYYTQLHPFALTSYTGTAINNSNSFRTSNSNGLRTTSFSNNNFNRFSNNSFYNNSNGNNRFNTNMNNNFFRSQSSQSGRTFSTSSFGGGGGGSHSFGRIGR
jgi:hypothetical protein